MSKTSCILTGNLRFRISWTGKLVLQVEVAGRWKNTWRDATFADVTVDGDRLRLTMSDIAT